MKRLLPAVVFLPIFYCLVILPPPYFAGLITAAAIAGLLELYRLALAKGVGCNRPAGVFLAVGTLYSFFEPSLPLVVPLVAGLVVIPVLSLLGGRPVQDSLGSDSVTVFAALFTGTLFGFQIGLRGLGQEIGKDLIFLLYLVTWAGDAAAYYVGSALGRRPLTPRVSPRKTIEGALAGVAGSLLAALLARVWFLHRLTIADCLILGLLLSVAGVLGDLVESMWKRGAGAKDSASLVPGHGGILDRSDSLLFGGPILYYYYSLWMR